jgi:acetylornithine deacetylase/succinyl-diaminopimelate desuccinylase-like protein
VQKVYDYIEANWLDAIEDIKRYCRQPSISAQGVGIKETSKLTADLLQEYGVDPQILPTTSEGPPVVYGELGGKSDFTLLFYNHYDVQPPEPLELWSTPPFDPTVVESKLIARGVSDDKGDILARLLAIKAFLKTKRRLPISVKFLIEGEEEVGSPSLESFVQRNRALLKSDACFWEGGRVGWEDRPEIILGLKGIVCVDLEVRGAVRDLHSSMGTMVLNPAWRLAWALGSIKDSEENILIEGFHDDVRPPTPEVIDAIKAIPAEEKQLRESLGIEGFLKGLTGEELRLYNILQPACNINGLISGYTGEGSKTVLPCYAKAKLDFRLVPDQRPEDILAKLRKHLIRHGFADVTISAADGERPARTPLDSPFVKVLTEAARQVYGCEPIIKPNMTGSGPMSPFIETLGIPVASSGVAYPDSRPHAPNENIRLTDFILGAKYIAAIMDNLGNRI